jgi:hypothetical protein
MPSPNNVDSHSLLPALGWMTGPRSDDAIIGWQSASAAAHGSGGNVAAC